MIYGRTSCHRLIRIKRNNRFKSEKFFQSVCNHIKLGHSAVYNHSIYRYIINIQLLCSLFQNIKYRINDILCILYTFNSFIIFIFQVGSHKYRQYIFHFFLCKCIVIGVAYTSHISACGNLYIFIRIVPSRIVVVTASFI